MTTAIPDATTISIYIYIFREHYELQTVQHARVCALRQLSHVAEMTTVRANNRETRYINGKCGGFASDADPRKGLHMILPRL